MKKNFSRLDGKLSTIRLLPLSAVSILFAISGCNNAALVVPKKIEFERTPQADSASLLGQERLQPQYSESDTPKLPATRSSNADKNGGKAAAGIDEKMDLVVSFDQMPLPAFIQAVYGGILKVNFSVDGTVASRTDLVTFHTPKSQSASQMANLTRLLLKSYGIAVQDFGGVIRIVPDTASNSYSPQIRRGRAQPDTPMSLRPVFHYIELDAVRVTDFSGLLRVMFGTKIQIQDDLGRNALLISGQSDDIAAAMEVIQVFDQPAMRGQRTKRVSPVFWTAEEFSKRLVDVLGAEGYSASTTIAAGTPILILPIQPLNSVIIFSSSDTVLNHVLQWAKELDKPSESQAGGAFFTYPVKYADAQALAKTLSELIGGGTSAAPVAATPGTSAVPSTKMSSKIVVNNATNSLIIQGGGADQYRQWMTLLAELDKPTKSALIDVMVAEVTAGTTDKLGVDWTFRGDVAPRASSGSAGTTGFIFSGFNAAGLLRTTINAIATRDNGQILSSPKIMARNGETATIQVGDEVPILTSTTSTPGSIIAPGTTTNTVQYRNTGVILKVRPVINSGNRIDLDISQEVSSVKATDSGVNSSPTISNRKIDTKLTLRDGSTVMLAGLISNDNSSTGGGVPLLRDIPVLGSLFKSENVTRTKKELVILITPYIINDDFEAESISNAFQSSLGDWAKDLKNRIDPASLKLRPPAMPISEKLGPQLPAADNTPKAATPVQVINEPKEEIVPATIENRQKNSPAPDSLENNESLIPSGVIMSKPEVIPEPKTPKAASANKKIPATKSPDTSQNKIITPPAGSKSIDNPDLLEELRRAVEKK